MRLRVFLDIIKEEYLDKDEDFTIYLHETNVDGKELRCINSDENGIEPYIQGNRAIATLDVDFEKHVAHVTIVVER